MRFDIVENQNRAIAKRSVAIVAEAGRPAPHSYSPYDLTNRLCDLRHRNPGWKIQQGTSVRDQLVMK